MTIPRHTIRAICDLLGLDPDNTAGIAINRVDATITTIDWNRGAFLETTHRIKNHDPLRKLPWGLDEQGFYISPRKEENPPIFTETVFVQNQSWDPHDGCDGTGCWCQT